MRSQTELEQALAGVHQSTWNRKPSPEQWSISECAEHILTVEQAVAGRLQTLQTLPPEPFNEAEQLRKDELMMRVLDRSVKIQAPAGLEPTSRYANPTEVLEEFGKVHSRFTLLASEFPDWLRGRFAEHPVFKKLDGYQWMLAGACHTMRHTAQILEVKEALKVF